MSAYSVSPPSSGTSSAASSDALAEIRLNELSECQYWLPRRKRLSLSSGSVTCRPLRVTFESEIVVGRFSVERGSRVLVFSSAPRRRLNATCASSSRYWPGNAMTP